MTLQTPVPEAGCGMDAEREFPWRRLLDECLEGGESGEGVRACVARGRQLLLAAHRGGASGTEVVRRRGAMMDGLLGRLFERAERDYGTRFPALRGRCAVVAQGGYGRGELNPCSDIDILFLYGWRAAGYVEFVTERILYPLWDAGLTVGHATRTVTECARRARDDDVIRTALVDARYICGDARLAQDLERVVSRQLGGGSGENFVQRKMAEHHRRHQQYGESVFLLEPDVKEGQGGLRDIHGALWVARAKCGAGRVEDLPRAGLLDSRDAATLESARDFLWRTRNELHFLAGRHQDRLTFESQEQAARGLGFTGEARLSEVETFMRSYYRHAEEVSRLSSLVIHRAVDHDPGPRRPARAGRELRPGVRVTGNTLALAPDGGRGPEELLDLFVDLQRHRLDLGQDARALIRARAEAVGATLASSREANRRFLDILRASDWIYETLLEMHRTGVLDALIPEFGRVRCMALHDLYHIYTVDQHLMRAVKEFERLRSGEFEEPLPRLSQLAREAERPEVLILGILFHDVGKGQGGNHSERGRRMALAAAARMGLNEDEQELLSFLVLHHLLLTGTAFRRDIEDEKTVEDLADTMGGAENIKALYLLTYSDMRAVGPDVWNNWKGSLLEQLFNRTLHVLEEREKGESPAPDRDLKVRRVQDRLLAQLAADPSEEVRREFIDAMPRRYFLTTPEEAMPSHYRLLRRLGDEPFLAEVRHHPEHGHSEVAICARDQAGLFAAIAGVFAAMELDVLSARINTRGDGLILDVFRISHQGQAQVVMDPEKWTRMESILKRVLRGEVDVAGLVARSRRSLSLRPVVKASTHVRWDNEASDDFTIIEVYTEDRAGVLFTITYWLSNLDFAIHLAKISTDVDRVADVFYVADGRGRKVLDEGRLRGLGEALHRELEPRHDG